MGGRTGFARSLAEGARTGGVIMLVNLLVADRWVGRKNDLQYEDDAAWESGGFAAAGNSSGRAFNMR